MISVKSPYHRHFPSQQMLIQITGHEKYQLLSVLSLTSLHHNKVDVSVKNYGARQVQLVGIGLYFKLLSRILQVTDPVQGR